MTSLEMQLNENKKQRNSKIEGVSTPVDNGDGTYTINLKKKDGSRTIIVSKDSNGNIQVDYNSRAN